MPQTQVNTKLRQLLLQTELPQAIPLTNGTVSSDRYMYLNLEVEDELRISYLPTSRFTQFDRGHHGYSAWTTSLRQSAKAGAVLKRLLADCTDVQIKELVEGLKKLTVAPPGLQYDIWYGEDVKKAYLESNYICRDGGSILEKSCMRYEAKQHFLNLYSKNPNQVGVAIVTTNNKICARGLLWTVPHDGTTIKILDRVYPYTEMHEHALMKWASSHCDYIRTAATAFYKPGDKNTKIRLTLDIELENPVHEYYPYLDTFSYRTDYNGSLRNCKGDYDCHVLTSQQGSMGDACRSSFPKPIPSGHIFVTDGTRKIVPEAEAINISGVWYALIDTVECASCWERVAFASFGRVTLGDKHACHRCVKNSSIGHKFVELKDTTWYNCKRCGNWSNDPFIKNGYCVPCMRYAVPCHICETKIVNGQPMKGGHVLCTPCMETKAYYCSGCGYYDLLTDKITTDTGHNFCKPCYERRFRKCQMCQTIVDTAKAYHRLNASDIICVKCTTEHTKRCSYCLYYRLKETVTEITTGIWECTICRGH